MNRLSVAGLVLLVQTVSAVAVAESARESAVTPASLAAPRPTRIVLVAGPELDDLANRFAAELASLHFEVVRAATVLEPTRSALEDLAREQLAQAVVRVSAAEGAIDLWLVNPTTHEAVYRRIVAERDPAVAVLRSLEILRGSLIDLRALAPEPPEPAPASKPAPAPAPAPARPEPARAARAIWLGVSGAATWIDARRAPAAGALVALHFAAAPRLWLHAEALAPLGQWTIDGEGGRVRAWASGLAIGGSAAPWAERTFTPALGLGVAALALHTRGEASAGFRGTNDLNVVVVPHARLDATLRILQRVHVRAQVLTGFAAPRPVLLFAEQRNATWVNPLVSAAIGLELLLN